LLCFDLQVWTEPILFSGSLGNKINITGAYSSTSENSEEGIDGSSFNQHRFRVRASDEQQRNRWR